MITKMDPSPCHAEVNKRLQSLRFRMTGEWMNNSYHIEGPTICLPLTCHPEERRISSKTNEIVLTNLRNLKDR